MTSITVWDERNIIAFNEGYLPSLSQLRDACPKRPSYLYANMRWGFPTRDEALAWTLTAIARREIDHAHRGEAAGRVELETWVLGVSTQEEAVFADWFFEKGDDYRIILQRQTLVDQGRRLHCCIGYTPNLPLRKQSTVARKKQDSVKVFLKRVLHAYNEGYPCVIELIQGTGHPYVYSAGRPSHREADQMGH